MKVISEEQDKLTSLIQDLIKKLESQTQEIMMLVTQDDIQSCNDKKDSNIEKIYDVESKLAALKEQWKKLHD